jgi:hypothetical protein
MRKKIIFFILLILFSCEKKSDFDELTYNYYGGFGGPIYKLNLNKDRKFQLKVDHVYMEGKDIFDFQFDSAKIGYFKGQISDDQMNRIRKGVFKITRKDYIYENAEISTDVPHLNLTINKGGFEHKIETLDATKQFETDFINIINNICEIKVKTRTSKFRVIE